MHATATFDAYVMTDPVRTWKQLQKPASFSSASYLAKTLGKKTEPVKKDLEKSLLYQAHRDLRDKFKKRSVLATVENALWEADLGDLGGQVPPEVSGQPVKPGRRKQLQFLVVVDGFTRKIYAVGLANKTTAEVVRGFRKIIVTANGSCERLQTDDGKEFKGRAMKEMCSEFNIMHLFAYGRMKSQLAEMSVKMCKRVIMGMVQSDMWPQGKKWSEIPEMASASLRQRYNRGIGASPNEVSNNPKLRRRLYQQEIDRAGLVPPPLYRHEQQEIQSGNGYRDGKKWFKINDAVLIPIPKIARLKTKDKNHMMHYNLMPMTISMILHGRRPAMYRVKNPRTGKHLKRLYYGQELKHASLPDGIDPSDIKSYKVVGGAVEYDVAGRREPVRVV